MRLDAGDRKAEHIRRDLADLVAAAAAAAEIEMADLLPGTALHAVHAVHEGKVQALDDGAVHVVFRVMVGKADHRAARVRRGKARRPVRQHEQTVAPGGDIAEVLVQNFLRRAAERLGRLDLRLSEVLLEPGEHPVAAQDLNFGVIHIVGHRRVRGHERRRLKVLSGRELHGAARAERERRLILADDGKADRLAALVRAGGEHRQPRRDAGQPRRLRRHAADDRAGGQNLAELILRDIVHAAGETVFVPSAVFVVIGDLRHEARAAVGNAAGEAIVEIRGQADVLIRFLPELRLVLGDPVAGRGTVEHFNRLRHTGEREERLAVGRERLRVFGAALIHPEDAVAQRPPVLAHADSRIAEHRHRDARGARKIFRGLILQPLGDDAYMLKIEIGPLLRPVRVAGIVRLFVNILRRADDVPGGVKQHRPHALRSDIKYQRQCIVHSLMPHFRAVFSCSDGRAARASRASSPVGAVPRSFRRSTRRACRGSPCRGRSRRACRFRPAASSSSSRGRRAARRGWRARPRAFPA